MGKILQAKDYQQLNADIKDMNEYLDQGRTIGNKGSKVDKFKEIAKCFGAYGNVVYSNFYKEGLQLFARYLDSIKIEYTILEASFTTKDIAKILADFKNKKIRILLLHPIYTEGLSIIGARQMHILEPVINLAKFTQLIGRVNRYQSHIHLPKPEQKIDIYVWVSTAQTLTSTIKKKLNILKEWLPSKQGVFISKLKSKFNLDISPDMLIINSQKNKDSLLKAIQERVKNTDNKICAK
jgi:superfamily II DNA or RNA helicase